LRFRAASDQALLVYLGEEISLATHRRVVGILRLLQAQPPPWLRNLQPAYCSLLVEFDSLQIDHAEVETFLCACEHRAEKITPSPARLIEIPVCYGGEFGPDLQEVASLHNLTIDRAIQLHSSHTYHAYFLGFAPGFAYLGDLPDDLATPRVATPRKKVPAGSVALAAKQTAVYPSATPGGWRLIARTPLRMFAADRNPMSLINIGDEVHFRPITPQEFASMERESA